MKTKRVVLAAVVVGGGLLGLASIMTQPSSLPQKSKDPRQVVVDAMRAFIDTENEAWFKRRDEVMEAQASQRAIAPKRPHSRPEPFNPRLQMKDRLDPNKYFAILPHLSMEPGYILDYVYLGDSLPIGDGRPVLYARKTDAPPLATLDEYEKQLGESVQFDQVSHEYLQHVQADGTADSFFELAVLRTMGDQFYLSWHANYNDERIICDLPGLESAMASIEKERPNLVPASVWSQGRKLDLRPQIQLKDNDATVSMILFSKWSGFSRVTTSFRRQFPHAAEIVGSEVLIPYDCGGRF